MIQKVRKAIVPAAGFGTRMLPITGTVSKEMLPIVDKPIIQVVVEELVEAGIEDIIIVTAAHKTDLVDYFGEVDPGLKAYLQAAGPKKEAMLKDLEAVSSLANFAFIEQRGVYGTGTPVLNAEPYLGGEPFIFTFADDFFVANKQNSFSQLLDVYNQYGTPVVACQRRDKEGDYVRYGYVGGNEIEPGLIDMTTIVEQPGIENKPGDLASIGGFVVTPDIFNYLHSVRDNLPAGQEFFFNSALGLMIQDGQRMMGKEITDAAYYDTGNRLSYAQTVVGMASRHPEIGQDFKKYLREFVEDNNI